VDGTEPAFEVYFFDAIRPQIEAALRNGNREHWPLITLNLDFKSDDPGLIRAVRAILDKYRSWLTTAVRGRSIGDVQPLQVGPVLVLTGELDTQQRIFFDDLPPTAQLLVFGAAHPRVHDVTSSPEALLPEPANSYRRWWNNPWQVVEPESQDKAGAWRDAKEKRLQSLVAHAHDYGYWIRFYTLDGGSADQFKSMGWFPGYNFGSIEAAKKRWVAAVRAGADFIASDQYKEVTELVTTTSPTRAASDGVHAGPQNTRNYGHTLEFR
jgi:hypothetical protein